MEAKTEPFFLYFNQTENHDIHYLKAQTEEATKDAKFPDKGHAIYPDDGKV